MTARNARLAGQSGGRGLRSVDSLHLACDLLADCSFFVTNDVGVQKAARVSGEPEGLKVVTPSQFLASEETAFQQSLFDDPDRPVEP